MNASSSANRSTAAQFFEDEDVSKQNERLPNEHSSSTYDIVVELLNNAAVKVKSADKIVNLRKAQELIVHKSPDLLDNFLDEMLAFQTDQYKDVKRFVIGFMEEACKKDFECLPKVMPSMVMLLGDDDINVQKKVILTVSSMFRLTLAWISKAKVSGPEMKDVWLHLNEVKNLMYDLLESDNDGIRTHVIKFLEGLTLTLSKKTQESEVPKNSADDFSLEKMPENNGIVGITTLEADGCKAFTTMLQFQGSPHISSTNLMTVMNSLANVAKQRPEFFDQVVQSFEALHVNLPPTLAKSQVSSVRKNLKSQMMSLLKHSSSVDFLPQISTLLTDLGASQSEIAKNTPKEPDTRKRKAFKEPAAFGSKKAKIELDEDDDMTPWVDRTSKKAKPDPVQKQTAIDVTAQEIQPLLSAQNVTDLVLISMVMLPDTMPALFESTYTPVAAAGTDAQISHIARLLATQLTMAGMGKGLGELQMQAKMKSEASTDVVNDDDEPSSPKQVIQTVVGRKTEDTESLMASKRLKMSQLPMPPSVRKNKFQLSQVTRPLEEKDIEAITAQSLGRIIKAEKAASIGQVEQHRIKLLSSLTSFFGDSMKDSLREFIFNDLRSRHDLIFAWLYQEYANSHKYSTGGAGVDQSSSSSQDSDSLMESYSNCLCSVLDELLEIGDNYGDMMFHRVLLEAPILTDNAIAIICKYCIMPEHTEAGMKTLSQLIDNRPVHRFQFLAILLEFTAHQTQEVRNIAIKAAKALHVSGKMQVQIEQYANQQLKRLLQSKPPPSMGVRLEDIPETWTEDKIKAHLYLHLGLLPSNHKMIHELASVYTATSADIKRTILRVLETPVKGMGMDSPELLTLLENCPKGSETLVMRVIHILTDKAVPSPQLVQRIRDLYHKRVPDVRFLIPVLNGLSKSEVMEALPKLIKLNPMVVKEVFNRLMGSHVTSESQYQSPLTPVELLIALHNIDSAKCEISTTIKAANLCFAEKATYTEEVLAIVMQQLMEQDPLPTLLMRTVIQSLSMYPRLVGFVLNILQRLIVKKVWKQKKLWDGFIRCCQRARPQSFQVLLKLPASQLKDVLNTCPDLREPLLEYVQALTDNQKAHINKAVVTVLEESSDKGEQKDKEVNLVDSEEIQPLGENLTTGVENNTLTNLTAVKTIETLDRPDLDKSKFDSDASRKSNSQDRNDRENSKEKDRSKEDRIRDRESSRDRDKGRERGSSREKDKARERDARETSHEKDRAKDRDSERDRVKEKEREREKYRESERERLRNKDKETDRDKGRDGERIERGKDKDKTSRKERDRSKEREWGKERVRSRSRERERVRDRSRERESTSDKYREKSSSKDVERDRLRQKDKDGVEKRVEVDSIKVDDYDDTDFKRDNSRSTSSRDNSRNTPIKEEPKDSDS